MSHPMFRQISSRNGQLCLFKQVVSLSLSLFLSLSLSLSLTHTHTHTHTHTKIRYYMYFRYIKHTEVCTCWNRGCILQQIFQQAVMINLCLISSMHVANECPVASRYRISLNKCAGRGGRKRALILVRFQWNLLCELMNTLSSSAENRFRSVQWFLRWPGRFKSRGRVYSGWCLYSAKYDIQCTKIDQSCFLCFGDDWGLQCAEGQSRQ